MFNFGQWQTPSQPFYHEGRIIVSKKCSKASPPGLGALQTLELITSRNPNFLGAKRFHQVKPSTRRICAHLIFTQLTSGIDASFGETRRKLKQKPVCKQQTNRICKKPRNTIFLPNLQVFLWFFPIFHSQISDVGSFGAKFPRNIITTNE